MDRHERAWAAGFFDGEGWAGGSRGSGRATTQPKARINQASADGVPDVLERFRNAVGVGHIALAFTKEGNEQLYSWSASSRADVTRTWEAIAPWLGTAKAQEFASALEIDTSRVYVSPDVRDANEELAWAAGFFDGEGSVYLLKHKSHEGYKVIEAAVTQSSRGGVPDVLSRFVAAVGSGTMYGPFVQPEPWAPVYRLKIHRQIDVENVIARLSPWLGAVKRQQAELALEVVGSQPKLPRGNPAWGESHKTHCIRGHEYALARVRPYVSRGRGVQPRVNKQCLTCAREAAKAKRDAKRNYLLK